MAERMIPVSSTLIEELADQAVFSPLVARRLRALLSQPEPESDYDVIERQLQGKPCGQDVPGTIPSWAGEDQVDPCTCVLDPGHSGAHLCEHGRQAHRG